MDHYVLNADRSVTKMTDLMEWAIRFDQDNRIVAKTEHGGIEVSTVFLGLAHRFTANGRPLLFETMIFGGPNNGQTHRCSTYSEAVRQHNSICRCVLAASYDQSSSSSSEGSGSAGA